MKRGFNTLNVLVGLVISFFIVSILSEVITLSKKFDVTNNDQDIISALQLYQILNISEEIEISNDRIKFRYLDEERELSLVNNKLILSPGTQIYYLKVDDINFTLEETFLYLTITREKKINKYLIGEIYE